MSSVVFFYYFMTSRSLWHSGTMHPKETAWELLKTWHMTHLFVHCSCL